MNPAFGRVGLWARISESFEEPYDEYQKNAHMILENVRKQVRGKYGDDPDIVRPRVAEELKFYIRCMSEQGGLENYKYALARWQIFKAIYPEWITDSDRPELIAKIWENVPHP